jgi:nitrite reductase/ring-hydroxylating ferredoxin subunit
MARYVKVANTGDLPPGSAIRVEVEERSIALFNLDGTFYAIDDQCPHQGASLSEGAVTGAQVICPWHAARFDLKTGAVLNPPAEVDVSCHRVRVQGSDLEIEI